MKEIVKLHCLPILVWGMGRMESQISWMEVVIFIDIARFPIASIGLGLI